jgi:aspartate-semialdehyde dehydrogenase
LADDLQKGQKKTNGVAERAMVAIVGGETLLARELRELLLAAKPSPRLQLIAANVNAPADAPPGATAVLAALDDEAAVMLPLSAENLDGAQVAFLAGTAASSRRALKINPKGGPRLIDLTGGLEDQPNARLRSPSTEASSTELLPAPEGAVNVTEGNINVIAHPAAIALTMLLATVAKQAAIRKSTVHIFEPASERGQRGIDELQQQTVAVLSFQKLKTDVFDTQLAFNLLAEYGEEAIEPLDSVEQRLERHLASLLAAHPTIPMPSLRLIQAPVFHGHSFSVWIEFEANPGMDALTNALNSAGIDVRPDEPPSNAGIAGVSGLAVGSIAIDRNNAKACWIWMVADNLKLAAENAMAVAKETML